jgi:ADP-ribose pyrophosphatase YjhB (NUDIX family)
LGGYRDATPSSGGKELAVVGSERCAGAIVFDEAGRLLLVRRGNPPSLDRWCEPSGRCRPDESAADACVRECLEETGLHVRIMRSAGSASIVDGGTRYDIEDFVCEIAGGTLRAGDDAAEVRWVDAAAFDALPLATGVRECFTRWGCLPR